MEGNGIECETLNMRTEWIFIIKINGRINQPWRTLAVVVNGEEKGHESNQC